MRPLEQDSFRANKIIVVFDVGIEAPEVIPATRGEALSKLAAMEAIGEGMPTQAK